MDRGSNSAKRLIVVLFGASVLAQAAGGQGNTPLLRLQRANAELEVEEHRISSSRNINDVSLGDAQDVAKYPNSISCAVVYDDGKYVFERREERTVGRPRVKSAEGTLSSDDLQRLKVILNAEDLKQVVSPKVPDLPPDTSAIREVERLDTQINRDGNLQQFTMLKERVKTGALISATSGPSTGMDAYLDNGAPYKKTLSPLIKWFDELAKKSKSGMKESKPQYCKVMNIG